MYLESSIISSDIADLGNLQSNWLRAFWLLTQETEFSQMWDWCRQKVNNDNFI